MGETERLKMLQDCLDRCEPRYPGFRLLLAVGSTGDEMLHVYIEAKQAQPNGKWLSANFTLTHSFVDGFRDVEIYMLIRGLLDGYFENLAANRFWG